MAGIVKRMLARLIDGLIFMLIAYLGGLLFDLILPGSIGHWMNFTYFIYLVYNITMILKFSQTIGKRAVKLKVDDELSRKLTIQQVLVRESIAFVVLYFTQINQILDKYIAAYQLNKDVVLYLSLALLLIDLSTLLFPSARRQLLHDFLANTKVISSKAISSKAIIS